MELSLSSNFDPLLIKNLKNSPVSVIYGKLTSDIIGGGRPSFALPQINKDQLEDHIKLVHSQGLEFNYLLNAVCLDNLECTRDKNRKILDLLDLIKQLGIDWVTVTVPYLIDMVNKILPEVKIMISTFANVDSVQKAQYYEKLGVQAITLPEQLNRNFSFLRQLRANVNLDIHLIATNDCLLSCPFRHHHPLFQSHASQSEHVSQGFALDYCLLKCTYHKLKYPEAFIQSPWIRPEDIKYYEEIGINKFKITERMKNTKQLLQVIDVYRNRSFAGNLAKILNVRMDESDFILPDFKYNDKPKFVDPNRMVDIYALIFANKVFIDNKKLNNFLEFFIKNEINCLSLDCQKCGYCASVAQKVITYDADEYGQLVNKYERLFNGLTTGNFFREKGCPSKFIWNTASNNLFDKMVQGKPAIFRKIAAIKIKREAEKQALQRDDNEIITKDLVAANFAVTPKKYHDKVKTQLAELGVQVYDD